MRWTWILAATVVAISCGGNPPPVRSGTPPVAGANSTPMSDGAKRSSTPAVFAPAVQQDTWFQEVLDPNVFPEPLSLFVGNEGIAAVARPSGAGLGVISTEHGKLDAKNIIVAEWPLAAAWESKDVPWTLFDTNGVVAVKRGFDGAVEELAQGSSHLFAHDIAVDTRGIPHVCFSVESEEHAKDFIYAARTGTGKAPWQIERLALPIRECRIVATEDSVHVLTVGSRGVVVMSRNKGDSWKNDRWSTDFSSMIAAARGPSGAFALAYSSGSSVIVKKMVRDAWEPVSLPTTRLSGGPMRQIALAVSPRDQVHVAFRIQQESKRVVFYAKEGDSETSRVAATGDGLALQLDTSDAPHMLFTTYPDHKLIHARRRVASDPNRQADEPYTNAAFVLAACATDASAELGQLTEPFVQSRAHDWCQKEFTGAIPTSERLAEQCRGDEAAACLVGGLLASKVQSVISIELATCSSRPTCRNFLRVERMLLNDVGHGADDDAAEKMLERGCSLGLGPACFQVAILKQHRGHPSPDLLAKACSAELPSACAAVLDTDPSNIDSKTAQVVRSKLAVACATGERLEGCNALAYMEERGLGGKKQPTAAADHLGRACVLGSAQSCARLILGPFKGHAPPKGLEPERLQETLQTACDSSQTDTCVALATAYETGWVVARDRDAATDVLTKACDLDVQAACSRLHKKPSK